MVGVGNLALDCGEEGGLSWGLSLARWSGRCGGGLGRGRGAELVAGDGERLWRGGGVNDGDGNTVGRRGAGSVDEADAH